jgi:hypothetical protein
MRYQLNIFTDLEDLRTTINADADTEEWELEMTANELDLSLAADVVASTSWADDATFFINQFVYKYMEFSCDSSWPASGCSAIAASRLLFVGLDITASLDLRIFEMSDEVRVIGLPIVGSMDCAATLADLFAAFRANGASSWCTTSTSPILASSMCCPAGLSR